MDEVNSKEITDETARSLAKRGITVSSVTGKLLFKDAQGSVLKTIRTSLTPFINLNIGLLDADVANDVRIIQARVAIDDFYSETANDVSKLIMLDHLRNREFALLYLEFARNNFIPRNLIEQFKDLGE